MSEEKSIKDLAIENQEIIDGIRAEMTGHMNSDQFIKHIMFRANQLGYTDLANYIEAWLENE